MEPLVLKTRNGNFKELLVDFNLYDFEEVIEENDDRSISFEIYRTKRNKDIFDNTLPDMLLQWKNEDYTIINVEELSKKSVRTKKVTGKHIFMETQHIYIEKDLKNDTLNEDLNGYDENDEESSNESAQSHFINPVADTIYNFFKDKMLKDYQIFAMLGNAKAESGLNPNAEEIFGNRQAGGKGIFQWDNRKFNLYDYAEEHNKKWQDLSLQLDFTWYELMTTENEAYIQLTNSKDLRDATIKFHDYYERSADNSVQKERRVKFAEELEKEFKSNKNKEKANSSYLDVEKGINYVFDEDGTNKDYPFDGPHYGIDIDYIYDDVYSTVSGEVTVGYEEGGFGNYVLIDAGDGLEFIFAHMSEIDVGQQQKVKPGTFLGVSGNTGKSTGPHLHFEIRQDGKAFDPMIWIEDNKNGTSDEEIENNNNKNEDDFEKLVPTYTLKEYLEYGFKDNPVGFTYEIIGEFPQRKEIKEIGGKNLLEHLSDGSEIFNYIYFATNKHIKIYSTSTYYEYADFPIIYSHNTDELKVSTDVKKLETYIAGYGGKKTSKETKNYNPVKTTDVNFHGNFIKKGTYRTENQGNYYEYTLNAEWGNEMIEWSMKKGKLGGRVKVELDDNLVGEYNTFSEDAKTEKVIIGTKISQGKHKIKVTFIDEVPSAKYEGKPVMYVGTKKGTIFNSSAILSGENLYKWFEDYKSPNYNDYSYRQAATLYDDKVDTKEELKEKLIEKINDEPEVEVSTSYIGDDDIKHNSMVKLIHKPMGFNTDVKVKKIVRPHPYSNKRIDVEFTNSKSTILKSQKQLSVDLKRIGKLN